MSDQLPEGGYSPSAQSAMVPEVITGTKRRELREARPTNELGRAFADVFSHFQQGEADPSARFETLTLDAVHPSLGLDMRLRLTRPAGGKIDDAFGATDSALIPVVSVDITVSNNRLTTRPTQGQIAATLLGAEVELAAATDMPSDEVAETGSAIGVGSAQLDHADPIAPIGEVRVAHFDLGVMASIEEAQEYGLNIDGFAEENPDLMAEYAAALAEFRQSRDQDLLSITEEADEEFVDWQVGREQLLVVDASVSRTASRRPEDDEAVANARKILIDMIGRVDDPDFAGSLNPNDYFSTSQETPVAGEIWMGDEVAHREIAGPLERVLADILVNGNLRSADRASIASQPQLSE